MQQQYGSQPMMTGGKPWWLWVVVVLAVVILGMLAVWYLGYMSRPSTAPSVPSAVVAPQPSVQAPGAPLSGGDTTTDINKDLGTVDLGNPGQDVNTLDADINKL